MPRAAQAFSRSCGTIAPCGDPDSTLRTVAPRRDPDSTAPPLPEGTLTVPFEPSLPEGGPDSRAPSLPEGTPTVPLRFSRRSP